MAPATERNSTGLAVATPINSIGADTRATAMTLCDGFKRLAKPIAPRP